MGAGGGGGHGANAVLSSTFAPASPARGLSFPLSFVLALAFPFALALSFDRAANVTIEKDAVRAFVQCTNNCASERCDRAGVRRSRCGPPLPENSHDYISGEIACQLERSGWLTENGVKDPLGLAPEAWGQRLCHSGDHLGSCCPQLAPWIEGVAQRCLDYRDCNRCGFVVAAPLRVSARIQGQAV